MTNKSSEVPEVDYEDGKKGSCCCVCRSVRSFVLLIIFGTFAIISGAVVMPLLYDAIMNVIVHDMMYLTPDSILYPEWVNPSIPLTSKFYFFEVQNPEEVYNGGKPHLIEKGPYTYTLIVRRDNVTHNGNGTISSIPVYTYVFDREKSVGPETDTFLSVNMPMTSTAYMMRESPNFIKESMSHVLDALNETMFIELSVADLLWGYDEPLFELINKFFPIPGMSDQFGFLIGYNNTHINGLFTVNDGVDDPMKLNTFDNWNGKPVMDWWFTPEANMMNGTDGMMYHPFVKKDEELKLFHPDYCRSMPYIFDGDEDFRGVPLRRYYLPPYAYENGTTYPPNEGFCQGHMCAPSGIQRMDACRFDSPMGMSNPHFLYGDPWLAEQIVGLNPDPDIHKNYFLLEPMMGMPYVMKQRLQISMYIEDIEGIEQMGSVRTMYLPALWFVQEVEVDDGVIKAYEMGFQLTALIFQIIMYTEIFIGALMVIPASIALVVTCYRRRKQTEDSLDEGFKGSFKQKELAVYTNSIETLEKDSDMKTKDADTHSL